MLNEYVKGKPYFTDINNDKKQFNYLTENIETDVLIIGGGVTGALCGYYFSKANIPSVVIEKSRIAHGSTSITTSLLQYELDSTISQLDSSLGKENAILAYKLCEFALNEIDDFIKNYGNNCDYYKRNTLFYTDKEIDKNLVKEEFNLRKAAGFNVEFIDSKSSNFSFPLKYGLLGINGGAELDPYKFTNELLNISCTNDLKIFENTEAKKINYFDEYIIVETLFGYSIKCKKLIVATGYNTELFTNKSFATQYNTFNIVSSPLKDEPWENKVLIRNTSNPYNYLRSTKDNRIILGGEDINFKDINNKILCEEKYNILECKLKSMFKNIDKFSIDYKYCGCFASTKDNLGFIGPSKNNNKNLWYCLGYGANGILFAVLGAIMLSKLYLGIEDEHMELFNPDRFDN